MKRARAAPQPEREPIRRENEVSRTEFGILWGWKRRILFAIERDLAICRATANEPLDFTCSAPHYPEFYAEKGDFATNASRCAKDGRNAVAGRSVGPCAVRRATEREPWRAAGWALRRSQSGGTSAVAGRSVDSCAVRRTAEQKRVPRNESAAPNPRTEGEVRARRTDRRKRPSGRTPHEAGWWRPARRRCRCRPTSSICPASCPCSRQPRPALRTRWRQR